MALVCIAPPVSDGEHLPMYLLAVGLSSWKNVCSFPLSVFKSDHLGFLLLTSLSSPYALGINPLSGT